MGQSSYPSPKCYDRILKVARAIADLAGAGRIESPHLLEANQYRKTLLAAALKLSTSVSNGWLSQRLGMGQTASASQFARRWRLTPSGQKATQQLW